MSGSGIRNTDHRVYPGVRDWAREEPVRKGAEVILDSKGCLWPLHLGKAGASGGFKEQVRSGGLVGEGSFIDDLLWSPGE